MFMTLLMLRYTSGRLDYVSAGHPFMLHYRAFDKSAIAEKGGGIAMAMVPDNSKLLNEISIEFAVGDAIVLYSDGISEAASPTGELYGMERFKQSLARHGAAATSKELQDALLADVYAYMNGAVQADDITIIVMRRTA